MITITAPHKSNQSRSILHQFNDLAPPYPPALPHRHPNIKQRDKPTKPPVFPASLRNSNRDPYLFVPQSRTHCDRTHRASQPCRDSSAASSRTTHSGAIPHYVHLMTCIVHDACLFALHRDHWRVRRTGYRTCLVRPCMRVRRVPAGLV